MGSAFLLPNAQSFSSGDRDSTTQPGRRCEMAAGGLYQAIQHSPQVLRPRFCRALQGADRGWQWQRLPQNGLRLRASQSSESQIEQAGKNLPGKWSVVGPRKKGPITNWFGGAGAWGVRISARNSWRQQWSVWAPATTAESVKKAASRRRSAP